MTGTSAIELERAPVPEMNRSPTAASALASVPPVDHAPMIRFLATDGTMLPGAPQPDISLACRMYRDMAMARALDTEALALQRQGQLSLWLQCLGQEAAQVGSVHALDESDMIFPSYREHAVALTRGITPRELLLQWRGAAHGGWVADHRRVQFYALVLGTQTLHAVGYALGAKMSADNDVTVAYFGDGAASQGDVSEALNWAAALKLPVLFFCQNNQWAISTPTSLQYGEPIHRRATGFGVRSWYVDGNDVLAVHAVTAQAAQWVRAGHGPALVEAYTFRMAGHSTSDDPKRYRSDLEIEKWKARDPLLRLERYLRGQGVLDDWFTEVTQDVKTFATRVRQECLAITTPELSSIFDQVYATPHHQLAEQKMQFLGLRALVDSLRAGA